MSAIKHRSPVVRSFRLVLRMPSEADERINAADLPEPCAALLRTVVKRTRLWPSEKADVAAELIDHVTDALAAEQSPEQIVADFGNPTTAAKLIRRSRTRQRHPIARSLAAAARGIVITTLLVIFAYAGLTARLLLAKPTIANNYIATINQGRPDPASLEVDGMLPHQHYNTARILWDDFVADQQERILTETDASEEMQRAVDNPLSIDREHPDFEAVSNKVRSLRPLLERVTRAAAKPDHGTPYATEFTTTDSADSTLPVHERLNTFAQMPDNPAEQEPLYNVLLPQLGDMRICTMLLGFDARLALHDAEPEIAVARWLAMLDLAEQSQTDGYLISSLVALSIHGSAVQEIKRGLADHAERLTEPQLVTLAHRLAGSRSSTLYIDLRMERMMLDDLLQRTFTDNGNGNGTITIAGLNTILELSGSNSRNVADLAWNGSPEDTLFFASLPASPALVADRKTQRRLMLEHYDSLEAATQRRPHENHERS
ncbi:MAG: hypothetical protein AAFO89_11715, partial [Planctomycetota bacterium]